MRVIAGEFRGRALQAPPGGRTRPITDRVKETLFNMIGHRLEMPGILPAIDVLDLFAGSGALGIESLSRGARYCRFYEQARGALRTLRANLATLDVGPRIAVAAENVWTARFAAAPSGGYGLVFVDPPYRDVADTPRVLDLFERLSPRVAEDGVVVFRHEIATRFEPAEMRTLRVLDDRTIGRMRVLLMTPEPVRNG